MQKLIRASSQGIAGKTSVSYRIYLVFLSLYISYITYFAQNADFSSKKSFILSLVFFLLIAASVGFLLHFAAGLFEKAFHKYELPLKKPLIPFAVSAFLIALMVLGITFLSCKPGAVNYDVSNQWTQAHSGEYNNWHPVLHTLWLRLLILICDRYSFLIVAQIILFAVLASYLSVLLRQCCVPGVAVLLSEFVVVSSKAVRNTMMYPQKDALFTLMCMLLVCFILRILLTQGEWLRKKRNIVLFGVCIAVASFIRQNALFFTIPLITGLYVTLRNERSRILAILCCFLLTVGILKCCLYPSLNIIYPENTVEESIGLPMTVLGDTFVTNPNAMDDESREFLLSLASEEEWRSVYHLHQYNSIKFTFDRELIKEKSLSKIAQMTLRTFISSPKTSFDAINGVTDLVWSVAGKNVGYQRISNSGSLPNVVTDSGQMHQIGVKLVNLLDKIMDFAPIAYLTQNIGVEMLILLLCGLLTVRSKGSSAFALIIPFILYNFATMLLLCGNDARFFHFFMTLSYPVSMLLLSLPRKTFFSRMRNIHNA